MPISARPLLIYFWSLILWPGLCVLAYGTTGVAVPPGLAYSLWFAGLFLLAAYLVTRTTTVRPAYLSIFLVYMVLYAIFQFEVNGPSGIFNAVIYLRNLFFPVILGFIFATLVRPALIAPLSRALAYAGLVACFWNFLEVASIVGITDFHNLVVDFARAENPGYYENRTGSGAVYLNLDLRPWGIFVIPLHAQAAILAAGYAAFLYNSQLFARLRLLGHVVFVLGVLLSTVKTAYVMMAVVILIHLLGRWRPGEWLAGRVRFHRIAATIAVGVTAILVGLGLAFPDVVAALVEYFSGTAFRPDKGFGILATHLVETPVRIWSFDPVTFLFGGMNELPDWYRSEVGLFNQIFRIGVFGCLIVYYPLVHATVTLLFRRRDPYCRFLLMLALIVLISTIHYYIAASHANVVILGIIYAVFWNPALAGLGPPRQPAGQQRHAVSQAG